MTKEPGRVRVEGVRESQQDADAEIGRSALDALEVAEVLTRALRERLLGEAPRRAEPANVRRDRLQELGKYRVERHTVPYGPAAWTIKCSE